MDKQCVLLDEPKLWRKLIINCVLMTRMKTNDDILMKADEGS